MRLFCICFQYTKKISTAQKSEVISKAISLQTPGNALLFGFCPLRFSPNPRNQNSGKTQNFASLREKCGFGEMRVRRDAPAGRLRKEEKCEIWRKECEIQNRTSFFVLFLCFFSSTILMAFNQQKSYSPVT